MLFEKLLVSAVAVVALAAPRANTNEDPAESRVLDRIAVVGASVSAGYQSGVRLSDVFTASLRQPPKEPITDASAAAFFAAPGQSGKRQLAQVLPTEPTLLVAVDFAFWFGYGNLDFDGKPLASEEDRLAQLDRGLALLADVDATILLGDFPTFTSGGPSPLMPSQVPTAETIAKLNARLREWAKPHANVVVLPLAEWIATVKAKQAVTIGEREFAPEMTATWMQPDGVHATSAGLAALVARILTELAARKLVDASDYLDDPAAILEHVRAAKPVEAGAKAGKR